MNTTILVTRGRRTFRLVEAYEQELRERTPKNTVMINLSDIRKTSEGKKDWGGSLHKKIYIGYEELFETFTIVGYKRSETCHDSYLYLENTAGVVRKILAGDLKRKRVGALFNRYTKYYYHLQKKDVVTIAGQKLIVMLQTKIYDNYGIGHKAYYMKNLSTGDIFPVTEYRLFRSFSYASCKRAS